MEEGIFELLDYQLNESMLMEQSRRVGQEQIHGILFNDSLSWQAIILDLINTEQLDPWNIDLILLSQKYLVKVRELEEANFFISSKVLLAASLLLRIKSQILLEKDLSGLDDILFGKKEEKVYVQNRINLDENIPQLSLRTPLPRFRKISLEEIMDALGKAINTETRRIRRVTLIKQYESEIAIALPKSRINLKDKLNSTYGKLKQIFSDKKGKIAFSEFAGSNSEEQISTFIPLLHLDHQDKVFLDQQKNFDEIWIWLKKVYEEENFAELEKMRKEVEEALKSENLDEHGKEAEFLEKNEELI